MRIAAKFLAQRQRCGVLRMGPADLDDVLELLRLRRQRRLQLAQTRQQRVPRHHADPHMHGRRESVIRGLAHVAMVIGVYGGLRAHLTTQNLNRPVRDHFVGVHVGLCARARLPNHQREVVVKLAVNHFLCGLLNRRGQGRVQIPELQVHRGAGLLDHTQGTHDRHRLLFPANGEVHDRALRLRPPIFICRDLQRAKAVGFGTGIGHGRAPWVIGVGTGVAPPHWRRNSSVALTGVLFPK